MYQQTPDRHNIQKESLLLGQELDTINRLKELNGENNYLNKDKHGEVNKSLINIDDQTVDSPLQENIGKLENYVDGRLDKNNVLKTLVEALFYAKQHLLLDVDEEVTQILQTLFSWRLTISDNKDGDAMLAARNKCVISFMKTLSYDCKEKVLRVINFFLEYDSILKGSGSDKKNININDYGLNKDVHSSRETETESDNPDNTNNVRIRKQKRMRQVDSTPKFKHYKPHKKTR